MAISIPTSKPNSSRTTRVYERFDSRVLERFWFIVQSDGNSVQMIVPTFKTERAARIFERCIVDHPAAFLLSVDGQLELARRIEAESHGLELDDRPAEWLVGDLAQQPATV